MDAASRAPWTGLRRPRGMSARRRCRRFLAAQRAITRCSSRTPSVSAAGPGCRMIDDFTSCSSPSRTAGTSCQPGRAATERGLNFLPHHEPKMMSGARRTTSSGSATMRPRPSGSRRELREHVVAAGDADQLRHPADRRDLRLVPLLEIDARPAREPRRARREPRRARPRVPPRARRPSPRSRSSRRACAACAGSRRRCAG